MLISCKNFVNFFVTSYEILRSFLCYSSVDSGSSVPFILARCSCILAAEALRKLQRERREVMAYLRLAQKALRERQGEDLRSLCCHTREQLDRLQALDAEIAALSAAS